MKLIVLFVLISIVTAQSCINCASQCGPNGRCLGCDNGFFLDNAGSCGRYTPIEDCKTYDIQTGGCAQCFPSSILQYGICQQLIQNCNFTLTNNTEICSQCNNSYVMVDDINCYSGNTANCPLGSLPRTLQTTGQGFCQKFQLQKCSIPSEDISQCKVCYNDYFNLNGVCNNLTSQVPCNNNSCQCQYYYNNNICYQFNIDGCLSSKDKLYCNLCNDTLVAVSGRCFEPVKIADIHCNVLQLNSDICTGCNFQYLLDPNNICVKAFSLCNDPKRSCEAQCNHPSLLFYNGDCYIKDPQCIAYDIANYKCTKCFEGFVLNSNNRCEQKEKCWTYASGSRNCQKCFTGFQLNPTSFACDKLPYNCRQMNNVGVCQTCSSFTELSTQQIPSSESYPANLSLAVNTSVCVYSTANCQYYNIFGFCEICKTNYIQKKHVCIAVATNCQVPSQTDKSKCQICSVGYELDSSSLTCYPRIEGCQQYAISKVCVRCYQGYVLRNGLCFYRDINCLEYNSKGFCLRCGNSLVPYYNQCVFYDPYCFLYDRNGFCQTALGGFSKSEAFGTNLQTNYRSFIAYVRNIQQQTSSSSSSSTSSSSGSSSSGLFSQISIYGGYFTSQGWIRVLPTIGLYNERIAQYDVNGRIRSCRDGYTLLNGNCVIRINYCQEYSSSNGLCARCNPFYHMGAGRKCIPTSSSICIIATSTGQFCSKCSSDYTLISGQCYFSRLNVIEYSSTNSSKITSVQNGYFVWEKNQIAYSYDTNCVNQQEPGKCLQCLQESEFTQSGMRNIDGKCVLVKENCARYSTRGLCEACSTGYLIYYGQCYPNNCLVASPSNDACLTCPFLFNYESGLCVNKVQSNCLVYDKVINFNATTTKSIACRFCNAGFYLKSDNTCQRMITNCETTDTQSGRCTQCVTGFIIYEEQCVKEIVGCQIYNRATSYTTCTQCIANYNLTNNQCYTLPPRCLELNSSGLCSKCQTGYNPIVQNTQSICIFTVSSCITYNRQGRCTVCAKNFVLQNNLCNFFVQGCQDLSNNVCIRCLSGFYLRNGYCVSDPNCITVESGVCTRCLDGFRLVNGFCVKNSIDNCLTQKDEDCLECLNGYMKIVLYGKVYCVLRRIIVSGCSTQQYPCPKCEAGFELRDDGLCYAKRCLYQLPRFSLRTCSACYSYYRLDPTNRFCILYNCDNPSCYDTTTVPAGFKQANLTGFLIEIQYCTQLQDDYSCRTCNNYRYPNVLIQWNLCYPSNCKLPQLFNCSGNCYNYFSNGLVDKSVCVADNCQTYSNDGTCSVCVKPFNVINGICLYQSPCLDYNPATSQCRSCRDPYTIVSGSCIPKNCTSYNPTDVSACLECQRGFELTVSKTCQLKYCTIQNQNYPCTQCITGYYFNQFTNLCHMYNCASFDYLANKCQQCEPQYKLTNDYCMPDQCANFNTATWKCVSCVTGYKLNTNGLCVLDNCCSFNGVVCSQCCSGYDYVQGLCRSRCLQNNPQGVCLSCRQGYKLNVNNECVAEIAGCITYIANQCTQCSVGLVLQNGRCIPKYCINYTESNTLFCTQCAPRFYALNTGLCYPRNCVQFNTTDWTCSQCESAATYRFSLIPNQGICFTDKCSSYQLSDFICRSCESTNTNSQYRLQSLNGSEACVLQCGLYYELVDSECKIKYCSNFYSNGKCQTCAQGYELEASTGLCKLKYCLNYNQQNCVQCQSGFVIDYFNKRYCVPTNCQNYNIGSDVCQKCQDGYVREYNLCVLRDCFVYNGQYVCQKCMQGFNLTQVNSTLICQKAYNSSCAEGYYFASSRGACQPIPVEYCRYINSSNPSTCLSCFPNYFLYQGICYSINGCQDLMFSYIYGCKNCINGFKLQGNLCVKDLCDQYEQNNSSCKTCTTGYFLVNGNCVSYSNFCVYGNVYQGCITCQSGYQSLSGICRKLPDNCALIDPTLSCIQCAANYVLSNGICYRTIPNCVVQRALICDKCDNLYAPSVDQRSCISKQPIRYCQQHDSTFDFCLLCLDGFKITPDRKCLAEFCSKYDLQTNVCTECENRTVNGVSYFYALRNDKCISISINFCSIPLSEVACRVCIEGFVLENGICKAQNCQVYRQNNQECSTCLPGFYLTQNNICRKYPDNCDVVNGLGNCTVCSSGFTLNSNGMCVKGTQFCAQYNGDGLCVTCQSGYYSSASRVCLKLPDNCVSANIFGQCLQCVDPFVLSGSGICYRLIQNCSRYNDLGGCVACANGFYLTANSICQSLPSNCLLVTSTGICRQCTPGFRLQNGICLRSIENCASYQGDTCSSCNTNFYLINGLCYKLPNNCIIVNQQSECLRCQSSFTLFQGSCYQIIQYCLSYIPTGECNECSSGFYVNTAGRCSQIPNNCNRVNINGICLECAKGFVSSNGLCFREVTNCFAYNSSTNLCRQCISGFSLIDGKCYRLPENCLFVNTQEICLNCVSGYTLQNGICYLSLPFCDFYVSNGICNRCSNGYYLTVNGTCTNLPQGCSQITANSNQGCLSCIIGYVLQGGICYKQYPGCFIYDQATRQCRQCSQNFSLSNGFCYQLPSNCLAINSQRQCIQCAQGFILQSGICYRQIENCITYSGTTCIQCLSGYFVINGACVIMPANCIDMSQTGTCLKCADNYFLQNGICYRFDKNCAAYDPNNYVCKACVDGYYLNFQFICQLVPLNCLNVNIYGNCTGCRNNFTLTNGLCYPPIPQCDNWNLATMLCAKCISGFFLRNGYCYRSVEYCAIYSPTNFVCIKCIDNYMMTNNICITCPEGFYVDSYGQCGPNPPNCRSANQFGQCLQCQPSFTILNNECSQQVAFCQNYGQNSQGRSICTLCYIGYYLKDMFTCMRLPNGCAQSNSTGHCLQCNEGYAVNSNGICYTMIAYCQTYQLSTGQCVECIENYYININQTCVPMLQSNCLFANSLGQCIQCVQSYVLVSSICYPAIPFCFNHSTSLYVCLQCFQGYYLFNRTCNRIPIGCMNMVNNICASCLQGYQLSNGLCMLIDNATCIKYQLITNICIECKAGFYLASNNLCVRIPEYCTQANNQGQCLGCIKGYTINNGICYKDVPNCLRWGQGTCLQCVDQYYLQNSLCYKFPDYCQTFDSLTLTCLKCVSDYQLSFGRCMINLQTSCQYFNPLQSSQCYTCKNSLYEYWVNSSSCQVITAVQTVERFCLPYPEFCTSVDLLGNCISCCFGSQLSNGRCIGTSLRSLNCDVFDSVNLRCIRCMVGYVHCDWLAICIEINLNCRNYNSLQQCSQCVQGFILVNGDCIKPAPGMTSSNNAACISGYSYSTVTEYGNQVGSCFRNKNELRKISSIAQYFYTTNKPGQTASAQRFYNLIYNPPSFLNNYFAFIAVKPQIIHYIQLQGSQSGYVTHYLIHYRNKENAPFICWNSCQKVRGNINGNDVAELKLTHPIIASQIRIYPLRWVGSIWMNIEMLVEGQ